jgi:hypothetical protein
MIRFITFDSLHLFVAIKVLNTIKGYADYREKQQNKLAYLLD